MVVTITERKPLGRFDVNAIRTRLMYENNYITNIWSRMPALNSHDPENDLQDEDTAAHLKPVKGVGTQRARTLEELYNKLNELKGKKLRYKEKLSSQGIKNKIKKRKKKDSRKSKKMLIQTVQDNNQKADTLTVSKLMPTKPPKPVFNSEGKVVFNKFEFSEAGMDTRNKKETNNPYKLLKKIEKQKEKLKHLEEKGEIEKVAEIKEKEAWKTAIQKAAGVKVRDDPALLQKSIKKKQQLKKQSHKKWAAREKQVKQKMDERQKKRQANIDEKKKKKKQKKAKQMVKRGRIIPGY